MKLDEILSPNKVWGKLYGIDFDIIEEYNDVVSLLKGLILLNSHHRVVTFMHTISTFENELNNILSIAYSGYPNQKDIKRFKNKCKKMIKNIEYLKSQLP